MTWLEQAGKLVSGERRRDYARPLPNFLRICLLWNVVKAGTGAPLLTPLDVANFMILMKEARQAYTPKDDNMIDIIGYAATLEDIQNHLIELGYSGDLTVFTHMSFEQMYDLLKISSGEGENYATTQAENLGGISKNPRP